MSINHVDIMHHHCWIKGIFSVFVFPFADAAHHDQGRFTFSGFQQGALLH